MYSKDEKVYGFADSVFVRYLQGVLPNESIPLPSDFITFVRNRDTRRWFSLFTYFLYTLVLL
jgi:hypothetical protein